VADAFAGQSDAAAWSLVSNFASVAQQAQGVRATSCGEASGYSPAGGFFGAVSAFAGAVV
jgi:hypothetical protein